MPSPEGASETPRRSTRAKQACRNCNARRVRCNVLEAKPCHNCAAAQVACELLPSKRGKYPRKRKRDSSSGAAESYVTPAPLGPAGQSSGARHVPGSGAAILRSSNGVGLHAVGGSSPVTPRMDSPSAQAAGPPATATAGPNSQAAETHAIDRTLFFGESNFLTCVAGSGFGKSAQPTNRLTYPITDAITTKSSKTSPAKAISISPARYNFLQSEDALTFPAPQVSLEVLRAYFRWFHPCFPVLDRAETARTVENGEISPLLLQAILFIGASYCDEETVRRMGFRDHPEAKARHYQRARLLYDSDWESNKVTVLQALFLMSFWRAGPLNEKNTRYWLGSAISLAQTRGFHRA